MTKALPLWASEKTAASLLDMKPCEFRALVADGHLPRGREIAPGLIRWNADDLRAIGRGEAIEGGIGW
ncbi:hypothetical protein [Paracoccus fontiphilus]|uniref:Transcriptional regulator, AlpA family n=1 Tax=Paracoccus fontiphilus TaxID=1815556 RepID=A0ABV7IP52_9RHOB|nr:hypothetical protein [Paracoccus fontiphilus]